MCSARECGKKYPGYSEADRRLPYAKYFSGRTSTPQPVIDEALARGPLRPHHVPPLSAMAKEFAAPGYSPVETGYGRLDNGRVWVATLTDMPGVRPEMWDWWFGWHSDASAKYKLWHPDAHRFAAIKRAFPADAPLTDRQRYIGNVSYIDEYIGDHEAQAQIAFVDPSEFG
ncbi:MAG: DAPG hydrolase family protein, partial [Actinomycetota bacterium]